MEITEVRIKLMDEAGERLQAFCSITFDDAFVIRDLKIIEGTNGPFVAMPSRKLTAHCHQCRSKNHLRAVYCNQCGARLKDDRSSKDEDGRAKLYADIAHPINTACREMIQDRVIREFHHELERAKIPGYVSTYDDIDHDEVSASPGANSAHHHGSNGRNAVARNHVNRPHVNDRPAPQDGAGAPAKSSGARFDGAAKTVAPPKIDVAPKVETPAKLDAPPTQNVVSKPEAAPRAPHMAPAHTPPDPAVKHDTFGAGIF